MKHEFWADSRSEMIAELCRELAKLFESVESQIVFLGAIMSEGPCEDCGKPLWSFPAVALYSDGPRVQHFDYEDRRAARDVRAGLKAALRSRKVIEHEDDLALFKAANDMWPHEGLMAIIRDIEEEENETS